MLDATSVFRKQTRRARSERRAHSGGQDHRNEQKEREGELIQKSLQTGDYVVLLDEHGSERTSVDFAAWMQKKMSAGPKRLVFIVGGPYGFSDAIHKRGNEEVSLSRMTLSHQMVRMFFVEQIYRAMTILNGEPYHHE